MKTRKHYTQKLQLAVSIIVMILASCGNSSNNTTRNNMVQTGMPAYSFRQQLFCLTMLSNLSASYNSIPGMPDSAIAATNRVLADPSVIQYIGNWKCVWGPVVFLDSTVGPDVAANSMFIAQQAGTDNYVVAIAGTNGASSFDWVNEDLLLPRTPWDTTNKSAGLIATGMQTALYILQAMTWNGATAATYLQQQAASASDMQVWVTGHSLGGTVGPLYALYLRENMRNWVPGTNTGINCLIVAGATQGDTSFARYYLSQMGATTTRVWNTRDVVPHAFEMDMLNQVADSAFYPADSVNAMPDSTLQTIKGLIWDLNFTKCTDYTQLQPDSTFGFTSAIYVSDTANSPTPHPDTAFITQALLQHVAAYGVYFNTLGFQQSVQKILNLPYPYFTDGAILLPIIQH